MKKFKYKGKPDFIEFIDWLVSVLKLPEDAQIDPSKVRVSVDLFNALADSATADPMFAWAFINKGPKKDAKLTDNEVVYKN